MLANPYPWELMSNNFCPEDSSHRSVFFSEIKILDSKLS